MKSTFASILVLFASQLAHAATVQPSNETVKPSTVEHVFILQTETETQPSLRFVQVDNGGSSDVSSLVNPSRLYATLHQDGEEFDIDANYRVLEGVRDVRVLKFDGKRATLSFNKKDDSLKDHRQTVTVDFSAALSEAATAHSDMMENYNVHAAIQIQ